MCSYAPGNVCLMWNKKPASQSYVWLTGNRIDEIVYKDQRIELIGMKARMGSMSSNSACT